ncbi:hypothetical protein [Paenibacillus dakarensis]|uniref:hypothetical protein n=1 Tax=Paenibacillus dakarensis TaxID=1527293 RepID=UPI0006D5A027|nr:hypothetical protein [Paenibacillus dakarensis]
MSSMDEKIQNLERLTNDFIQRINSLEYEQVEEFVENRESITESILSELSHSTLTEAQKHRLKMLLQYDSMILGKMQSLKEEAREWTIRQNQIKAQHSAYESAYTTDSILMDKRK